MPDATRHISQAERNENFCQSQKLCGSKYQEWAIVIFFYAAMHYIDAVLDLDKSLAQEFRQPIDHKARKKAVAQCASLKNVGANYIHLEERSRDVRYKCLNFPKGYASLIETKYYNPVQSYLRKQLKLS